MKKLLALLMAVILTLALVGCGDILSYEKNDYYTQEEVDELIQNAIDELQQQNTDVLKALNDRYVQMEIGDDNLYFHCYLDGMVKACESVNYQDQIDVLYSTIAVLEDIIFENERRLDSIPLDIEIMYGEFNGVDDDNYVLVMVGSVEYKTFHISDETIYWGSDMVVIRIGDVYLSYVNRVR
jgi:hypothetical protein